MKRIFILMMLCASVISLLAETAYEKKVNDIKMEYFLFFKNGFYSAATMEDYYLISMLGGVDGALAMAQLDYGLKYPDQMKMMTDRMNKELEQAKSLMSEEDRINEWKKSDYGKMVSWIEKSYSAKFTKDEFETKNQYYTRIMGNAKSFFNEKCTSLYEELCNSLEITLSPVKYDAETQTSTIKIIEQFKFDKNELKKEFITKLSLPSHQARNLNEYIVKGNEITKTKWGVVNQQDVYVVEAQIPLCLGSGTNKNIHSNFHITIHIPNQDIATPLSFNIKQIDSNIPWDSYWESEIFAKNLELLNKYNKELADSVKVYNEKLASHPYYIVYHQYNRQNYSKLPDFVLENIPELAIESTHSSTQLLEEKYLLTRSCLAASNIKQMQEQKLSAVRSDYQKINSSMETICKMNNPEHHAKIYCSLHPEFAAKVDSVYHDYRCKYDIYQVAIKLLANEVFNEPICQETLYNKYSKLFKSEEEFLQLYDELSLGDFTQELNNRHEKINNYSEKLNREDFKKLIFLDAKTSGNPKLMAYIDKYEELKEMCNYPVSEFINRNTKMLVDFQKTTNYWSSMDEFFEAYISGNYKQILKNKKKQK